MRAQMRPSERGFSLVEMMAALTVFALITVGVAPLLLSSMKSSTLARQMTIAKNLAQESIERIRGLPYFETAVNRDVLDLYFPNLSTGYSSTDHSFTTTCTRSSATPSTSGALACPTTTPDGQRRIPQGYTVTYRSQFVTPDGGAPESFTVVAPSTSPVAYDSATAASATPPASLLRMRVTVSWSQGGTPRSHVLETLVGDRKLSPERVRGTASVDYILSVNTAFKDALGNTSALSGYAGRSTSHVEIKAVAAASAESSAARMTLVRNESTGVAGTVLDRITAAEATFRTPPNATPSSASAAADTIDHPDLATTVGHVSTSVVNEASTPAPVAAVNNGLPIARTNFALTGGVGTETFWVTNQVDPAGGSALRSLDPLAHMFSLFRVADERLRGNTSAEATALTPSSSRKVHATAHAEGRKVVLLPTTFILGEKGVVIIDSLVADVDCKATGTTGTSYATGSWSAVFRYWRDSKNNGVLDGGYTTVETAVGSGRISGSTTSTATDPFDSLHGANNPLVYDALLDSNDVYLFEENGKLGYFKTVGSTTLMSSANNGKTARVAMPYAITITTAKTNEANPQSELTVNIGKLSCLAEDKRV